MRVCVRLVAAGMMCFLLGRMGIAEAAASATTGGPAGITLLSQTPWVEQKGTFQLHLSIRGPDASGDAVQVLVFEPLRTLTDFDNALGGKYNSYSDCCSPVAVSSLPADRSGGVDLDLPVNQAAGATSPFPTVDVAQTSVIPVQVSLLDRSGASVGAPIDTFLVYAVGPASVTDFPPLSVAVVLPFSSPPVVRGATVGPLGRSESARLHDLSAALIAHPGVDLSVQATPQTLEALEEGSPTDIDTLNNVATLAQAGTLQVLPSTYAVASVSDMEADDLGGQVTQQLNAGTATVTNLLKVAPAASTWAVDGQLDATTLGVMTSVGATQLIVPDADLTPLPPSPTDITFAYPTLLANNSDSKLSVYGADPGLTSDFARDQLPVLAANQLLAQMAMIQLEQPGYTRGVAVVPPSGWVADPSFVATLVAGLDGDPLLAPVTATKLFTAVQEASVTPSITRNLADPGPPVTDSELDVDAPAIRDAQDQVDAVSTVLPGRAAQELSGALQTDLLTAESTEVREPDRLALLKYISAKAGDSLRPITLPGSSSITLTSTHGQIPLTILSSRSLQAHVQLDLSSQRLIFQAFSSPEGSCVVGTTLTSEVCTLILTKQNNTIKVPVQTRSSGVFPLTVTLYSPDGTKQLAQNLDTVRSTAVSGVGVVLIVLAVLSLALWWARDLRRGRRARRLVPSPIDLDDPDPAAATVSDDPVVSAFFAQPPPEYG